MNVSLTAGLIAYIDARVDSGSFRRTLERKEP